jgi:hypothetical protein
VIIVLLVQNAIPFPFSCWPRPLSRTLPLPLSLPPLRPPPWFECGGLGGLGAWFWESPYGLGFS